MKKHKSIKNIKTKSIDELKETIGLKKAKIIYGYFNG